MTIDADGLRISLVATSCNRPQESQPAAKLMPPPDGSSWDAAAAGLVQRRHPMQTHVERMPALTAFRRQACLPSRWTPVSHQAGFAWGAAKGIRGRLEQGRCRCACANNVWRAAEKNA